MDARQAKTQAKVFQALRDYYEQGERFEELTVKQIALQASIARQTFHRNYPAKEVVITMELKNLITKFERAVDPLLPQMDLFFAEVLRFWENSLDYFKIIKWANQREAFVSELGVWIKGLMPAFSGQEQLYMTNYYASMVYTFIQTYLEIGDFSSSNASEVIRLFREVSHDCGGIFENQQFS